MNAEFHPEAEEEFIEASLFYDLQLLGLGEGFISELERVTKLLVEKPKMGARIDETFRRMLLNRFPYSLIYSIKPERIWIVAVAFNAVGPAIGAVELNADSTTVTALAKRFAGS